MNVLKLANPLHAAREAAGLAGAAAGTVTGAAGVIVSRSVGAGRQVLHLASTAEDRLEHEVQQPPSESRSDAEQPEPQLPGPDIAEFEPQPPAEPPIDVVGAALAGDSQGPVTEGGAVVEPFASDEA